ncbi:MAG: YggT family protein [Anaerolineales bacterium]|nr:YggT family protein [Anaerolineales bacterium]MCB0018510.1 YggT family protein [Anaerolineales bacterium]MCB0028902.1 YggT family protein [Anaerolineales bacterium]MCB8961833.1 YggT family protein [Ardenticatenales bacterium]
MITNFIATVINVIYYVFVIALLVRMILSFVGPYKYEQVWRVVRDLTEPVLAPVRRILPPMGGLDFSPMIVLLVAGFLRGILLSLL